MTDKQDYKLRVQDTWGAFFGLETEVVDLPDTHLFPREHMSNTNKIEIFRVGGASMLECDPVLSEGLSAMLNNYPDDYALTAADIAATWTQSSVEVDNLYYLFPPDYKNVTYDQRYLLRQLDESNRNGFYALVAACPPGEVAEAEVALEHEIGFGAFIDGYLVAVASAFDFRGFGDVGVLTHPAHRGRDLGKAVTAAVAGVLIQQDRLVQYRAKVGDAGSNGVAKGLGMTQFGVKENVIVR